MTHADAIQSAWTRSIKSGRRPDGDSLRDHLLAVHRRHAGFTESCVKRCRDSQGRNSYEWLADVLDIPRHRKVMDLACGSGPLLELCRARYGDELELVGVDMSADELALARKRLDGAEVALHQGLAQDLAFAAGASVDAVLCHWALTLMDPVAPVLEEVTRVLRPGGLFAAIIDGESENGSIYDRVHRLIYARVQQAYPLYGDVDLGDVRVRSTVSVADMMRDLVPSAQVQVDPGFMRLDGSARLLAEEAAGFFYASFVLSAEDRRDLLAELEALFDEDAAGGQACFAMPVNRLVVRVD